MGVQLRYGTIAVGAYAAHQPGSHQRAFTDQYYPQWDRGSARSLRTWRDQNRWVSLWPRGQFGMSSNDGSFAGVPIGLDYAGGLGYEPFSCDGPGQQSLKFLKGQCVDTTDAALSGVVVQAFRTSDDAFAGYEVQSREDGSFDLATNFPGVNHYLVAYLSGSPDRGGTTLNTLTPANIDGT